MIIVVCKAVVVGGRDATRLCAAARVNPPADAPHIRQLPYTTAYVSAEGPFHLFTAQTRVPTPSYSPTTTNGRQRPRRTMPSGMATSVSALYAPAHPFRLTVE